jgi:hypothetical protein
MRRRRRRAKVLLALMAGSQEDAEIVRAFFQDMHAWGSAIRSGDGAPRVLRATEDQSA